ncbi:NAD(P)/FAD-dependent oxidoreductase [Cohnella sp.]|uniref:NAD(P)/FAD-dependent oxidoreductase n=1 Tax=Cohnella sp. TaxID=1883426 RepID=UPI00356B4C40
MIVGGGIAGLQAAIQLGRYRHKIMVIDADEGRSNLCRSYNNIIGWPDGIGGPILRSAGKEHAQRLGVQFLRGTVVKAVRESDGFILTTSEEEEIRGRRLLLATGVKDRLPDFPELIPCMGLSVYVCPDCDGYEVSDKRTLVIGSGNVGGQMALTLSHWTADLIYVNHEQAALDNKVRHRLEEKGIVYFDQPISSVLTEGSQFRGVVLKDGDTLLVEKCFIAFGGNEVHSSLAEQLDVRRMDNNHIPVDPRTKMTNAQHVWAAGDVSTFSEMVTIAMGEGSQAAVWIHKSLIGED